MKGRTVTIWDGVQYRQVSEQEAKRLVDKDMAQVMSRGMVGGTEMKFRRDFTGYQTREVRAEKPVAPAPVAAPKPAKKKKAKKKKAIQK